MAKQVVAEVAEEQSVEETVRSIARAQAEYEQLMEEIRATASRLSN